jgi:hypothetical protein
MSGLIERQTKLSTINRNQAIRFKKFFILPSDF